MRFIPISSCSNKPVLQHTVEVLSLLSDDVETDDASPGENLKLRLKGIEEEEILPGFILCSPDNLCHSGRTFDAQVGTTQKARRVHKPKFNFKKCVCPETRVVKTLNIERLIVI